MDDITASIARHFDYPFEGVSTFIPPVFTPPTEFTLGLIVGPSGSGKSSLLHAHFGEEQAVSWQPDRSVASHFSSDADAVDRLSAVGFNSIPSWVRPYVVLSTGERFRADLARRIGSHMVVDEFTSVVDRNVAKSCAAALRRHIDSSGITQAVLATCHYDVIDWLQPDWVFDTATGVLERGCRRQRPPIDLEILPCSTAAWPLFSPHHYLDAAINKSARCWLTTWGGVPIGFASALAFPNGNFKNAWREHRTVVLPDYQGLGIGVRLSDAVAKMFVDAGGRYFSKTAHPRMGGYREQSPLWQGTSKNRRARLDYAVNRATKEAKHKDRHTHRTCFSHEYIG